MFRKTLLITLILTISLTISIANGQSSVKINFQSRTLGSGEVPEGYLPDYGDVYDDQGNGYSYGWSVEKADSSRDRDSSHSPDQRYDTHNSLNMWNTGLGSWEIELPNATYDVYIVGGDPDYFDSTQSYIVEGVEVLDETPYPPGNPTTPDIDRFDECTITVSVNDGRLTIDPIEGIGYIKICFIHIIDIRVALPVSPENDSILSETTVTLEWLAGVDAIEHDVYLGEDYDAVNEATTSTPDIYKGRQTELVYPATGTLELDPGKTYYWRIDEYDGTNVTKGGISKFTIQVVTAYNPEPVDNCLFVDPNASLSWSRGSGALVHYVYFGDNYESVRDADASSPEYKGKKYTTNTSWDLSDSLELNKTYYWRVDEQSSSGVNKGDVWSFTTASRPGGGLKGQYYDNTELTGDPVLTRIDPEINFDWGLEAPEPNVTDVDNFSIRWTGQLEIPASGQWTFWTNMDDTLRLWVDGQLLIDESPGIVAWYSGSITLEAGFYSIVLEFLDTGNVALVRLLWQGPLIPERQVIPSGALQPPLWAFVVSPKNGAVDIDQRPTLEWSASNEALEHDVYFGTDYNDVANADTTTPDIYRGRQALDNTTYTPSEIPLDWNQIYYWRVDEVNDVNMWQGSVWSFTTADFACIDDFESYNDLNVGEEGSNRIYLTWTDGYDNPTVNGSTMGYPDPDFLNDEHFVETGIVHSGSQSAPLFYDNSTASYSEVTVNTGDLKIGSDWTHGGAQAMVLWFYGNPDNAATEQMYIEINNTKLLYDGDASNITTRRWTQWNIDLASIGVSLSNITSFSIGFERTGAAGGSGVVFIDDIRLYTILPAVIEPVDPGTDALVAHYAFENNTEDSSGNNLNGIAVGNTSFVPGATGLAIEFDGVDGYVDCGNSASFDITEEITLSAWVNTSDSGNSEDNPFVTKGDHTYAIKHSSDNDIQFFTYDGSWNTVNSGVDSSFDGDWHHVAGTYDGSELKIYVDSVLKATTAHEGTISTATDNLAIGINTEETDRLYNGAIDEVRIYNRALSATEILFIMGQ